MTAQRKISVPFLRITRRLPETIYHNAASARSDATNPDFSQR